MTTNYRDIGQRMRDAFGKIAVIPAGYARLGRGDSSGVIVASIPQRLIYYYDGTNSQPTATAKLAQDINITSITNASLEGVRVRLGYPPYDPKVLYIVGFDSGEGIDAVGGATPQEQLVNKAVYPDVGSLQNLRVTPQKTPDLTVFVNPTPYYDNNGDWTPFGGDTIDLTADIAALASGEHQMIIVSLDITTGDLVTTGSSIETGGQNDKDVFDWTTIFDAGLSVNYIPAGAVHIYDGQTEVVELDVYRSADPRAIFGKGASGGGGGSDDALYVGWIGL